MSRMNRVSTVCLGGKPNVWPNKSHLLLIRWWKRSVGWMDVCIWMCPIFSLLSLQNLLNSSCIQSGDQPFHAQPWGYKVFTLSLELYSPVPSPVSTQGCLNLMTTSKNWRNQSWGSASLLSVFQHTTQSHIAVATVWRRGLGSRLWGPLGKLTQQENIVSTWDCPNLSSSHQEREKETHEWRARQQPSSVTPWTWDMDHRGLPVLMACPEGRRWCGVPWGLSPPPVLVFQPQHRTARQGGSHTASPGLCQPSLPTSPGPPGFFARACGGHQRGWHPAGRHFPLSLCFRPGDLLSPSPLPHGCSLYSKASASCRYQSRPLEGSKTPLFNSELGG